MDLDNIEEVVDYINDEIDKGKKLKEIESGLGFNDRVLYKRLARRGYKRSEEGNRPFILVDDTKLKKEDSINSSKAKPTRSKVSKNLTNDEIDKLRHLLSRYDDILHVLDIDSGCNTIYTQHIQDIDNIQIIQTTDTRQKMFRVDVKVLDRWNKFCEEHKHIKVQSLISSALLEYIEKYSRE